MNNLKWIFAFLALVLFIQCEEQTNNSSSDQPPAPTPPAKAEQAIPFSDAKSKGSAVDINSINQSIQKGAEEQADWINSPVLVALKMAESNFTGPKYAIRLESENGEVFTQLNALMCNYENKEGKNWNKVLISDLSKSENKWEVQNAVEINQTVIGTDGPQFDASQVEQKGQTMSFSDFNQEIVVGLANNQTWVNSPIEIAMKFLGADMETRLKTIELEEKGSKNEVSIAVIDDGYLDDSIRGGIVILQMSKNDQLWQIKKASQAWNCWRDRGHQDYSTEPCS